MLNVQSVQTLPGLGDRLATGFDGSLGLFTRRVKVKVDAPAGKDGPF